MKAARCALATQQGVACGALSAIFGHNVEP
jgi:hypothetical protein